jgi:hypothetical protein
LTSWAPALPEKAIAAAANAAAIIVPRLVIAPFPLCFAFLDHPIAAAELSIKHHQRVRSDAATAI